MTRRSFVAAGTAFAGGCCGGWTPAHGEARPSPKMKIGILSDIHVTRRENAGTFEKALRWFRDQGVDGVLITGDLGTKGTIAETEVVAETWYQVFPDDKAPDGHRVERLFLLGNHDVDGFASKSSWPNRQIPSREEAERTCLAFHREETWKRLFNEDFSQIVVKEVKGYKFILNSWVSRELHEKDMLEDFWRRTAWRISGRALPRRSIPASLSSTASIPIPRTRVRPGICWAARFGKAGGTTELRPGFSPVMRTA